MHYVQYLYIQDNDVSSFYGDCSIYSLTRLFLTCLTHWTRVCCLDLFVDINCYNTLQCHSHWNIHMHNPHSINIHDLFMGIHYFPVVI